MELKPNLIALLIGNLASFLVSSTVIAFAMFNIYPFGDAFPIFVVYMLYSLLFYFATNLLAALGGLYIGYIRRKKGMGVVGDITIKNGAELPRL